MKEICIETNRLILKGIFPALIHEVFNTMDVGALKKYFGVDDTGLEHYKEMHAKGMETHRISFFSFLLIAKQNKMVIGESGFHTWNNFHRRAELFYSLRSDDHKQKGLMSEAVEKVLQYGFEEMNLNRIQAMVAYDNIPSLKILSKHKFTFEGTMRADYVVNGISEDSDCYSLLKDEWMHNNEKAKSGILS